MAGNGCMLAGAPCQYPDLAWHSRGEFSPLPPLASLETPIFPQDQNSFCHLDYASAHYSPPRAMFSLHGAGCGPE